MASGRLFRLGASKISTAWEGNILHAVNERHVCCTSKGIKLHTFLRQLVSVELKKLTDLRKDAKLMKTSAFGCPLQALGILQKLRFELMNGPCCHEHSTEIYLILSTALITCQRVGDTLSSSADCWQRELTRLPNATFGYNAPIHHIRQI